MGYCSKRYRSLSSGVSLHRDLRIFGLIAPSALWLGCG